MLTIPRCTLIACLVLASCASSHPSEVNRFPPGVHSATARPLIRSHALTPQPGVGTPRALDAIRIALLLPLGGEWAEVSAALRQGVIEARTLDAPGVEVRVYDTGPMDASMLAAYERAIAEGARAIIGPLRMPNVTALAQRVRPSVTVVALNVSTAAPVRNLFHLAPVPMDQIRSAADDAARRGFRRMIALVQRDAQSSRMLASLKEQLALNGARLVGVRQLDQDSAADVEAVEELMDSFALQPLDSSSVRASRSNAPGAMGKTFDAIFLLAGPQRAPVLIAELRRYRNPDLPIYTLAPAASADAQTMGVITCDMPYVMASMRQPDRAAKSTSPMLDPIEDLRLRAVGADAYAVVQALLQHQGGPRATLAGATGHLTFAGDGAIRRSVPCVPLQQATASGGP